MFQGRAYGQVPECQLPQRVGACVCMSARNSERHAPTLPSAAEIRAEAGGAPLPWSVVANTRPYMTNSCSSCDRPCQWGQPGRGSQLSVAALRQVPPP